MRHTASEAGHLARQLDQLGQQIAALRRLVGEPNQLQQLLQLVASILCPKPKARAIKDQEKEKENRKTNKTFKNKKMKNQTVIKASLIGNENEIRYQGLVATMSMSRKNGHVKKRDKSMLTSEKSYQRTASRLLDPYVSYIQCSA